jgi:mediator of RNA polymerase II transcription subunit 17
MSGSASTTDVALRPWPAPKKEKLDTLDVVAQIHQLTSERGHLRYITEQSLQDEVDAGKDVGEDVMEGIEGGEKKDEPSKEDTLRKLHETRRQMLEKAQYARL